MAACGQISSFFKAPGLLEDYKRMVLIGSKYMDHHLNIIFVYKPQNKLLSSTLKHLDTFIKLNKIVMDMDWLLTQVVLLKISKIKINI